MIDRFESVIVVVVKFGCSFCRGLGMLGIVVSMLVVMGIRRML